MVHFGGEGVHGGEGDAGGSGVESPPPHVQHMADAVKSPSSVALQNLGNPSQAQSTCSRIVYESV